VYQAIAKGFVHLHPQATNCDIHHVGIAVEVNVPDQGGNFGARQHLASPAHEQMQ